MPSAEEPLAPQRAAALRRLLRQEEAQVEEEGPWSAASDPCSGPATTTQQIVAAGVEVGMPVAVVMATVALGLCCR